MRPVGELSEGVTHSQQAVVTGGCSRIGAAAGALVALGDSLIRADMAPSRAGSRLLLGKWCFDVADGVGRVVA